MKIGNITFPKYPVFLAPMEDVTDISFRLMCKKFGADMVYTEFVSSDALIRNIQKTQQKLTICEEERPDILDINFGCPVKKVAGKGAGSGMLRTPELMLEITEQVVKAVNIPVTVKTRLGWDNDSKIIVSLAEQLQDCGIKALTIHGRTRAQMYTGEADWSLIANVKNNPYMHIPIIGNGDVDSPQVCKERFDETGVDAVMIGRACFGAPWIFREVKHFLETGEILPKEPFQWYLDVLKQQVLQSVELIDERRGILHIRRHLAASPLFKGIPDFKSTRIAMLRAGTLDELFVIMDSIGERFDLH